MASTPAEKLTKGNARRYLTESKLLSKGALSIYQLQLQTVQHENKGDPVRYRFGNESLRHNVKTTMVLGATGSGKTTLINALVNYILGVEWRDTFRYSLIHEQTNKTQAESQTSSVTAYELCHREGFRVPYSLIIIDTPGFGDTRGIEQDKLITEQIREFFTSPHGADQIDLVCFVAQSALARLTHTQKYIFDSIISIFGKDIAENIRILVTFADGGLPSILEAINEAKIPCPKDNKGQPIHFKFNNSALFSQTGTSADCGSDEENFDQMFWKMGSTNMKKFFAALNEMPSKSLSLTKEVLQERKQLDAHMQGLQLQIKVGLIKLDEIKKTQAALEEHKSEVEKDENFEYEVQAVKAVQRNTDHTARNCESCKFTCHDPCDGWTWFCPAIDWSGNCRVCPGKCGSGSHQLKMYKYEYVTQKEKKTYKNLKGNYEKVTGQTMNLEKLLEYLWGDFFQIQDRILELVKGSSGCLARLKEIALRPNPLSTLNYIDLMIQTEKEEGKPGFLERIESLNEVKKQAELLTKVSKNQKLTEEQDKTYKHQQRQKIKQSKLKQVKDWFLGWFSYGEETPTPAGAVEN